MKRGLLIFLVALLIINASLIFAQNDTSVSSDSEKVNKAYDCLDNQIDDKTCDKLSTEEKAFSLLSVGKCKSNLLDSSTTEGCWSKSSSSSNCDIKTTAQSVLALDNSGVQVSSESEWLLSQNTSPSNMIWYLQIDSSDEPTSCSITYSGSSYSTIIDTDKKLTSGAGNCLSLTNEKYWLEISPRCYDNEFEISCDKGFTSNLLFKKSGSSVLHVLDDTNSASAEGTTIEKVDSLCFKSPGSESCDYEGSLWATFVLKSLDYDISPFIPYLITMSDEVDNSKYLSESFLYFLTGNFRGELLSKQKFSKYWDESKDKFYDTAIALMPLKYESPVEKSNSINWLLEPGVQDTDGCWKGNLRNTAFLLYSIWPKENSNRIIKTSTKDCTENNYYCMSEANCNGEVFSSSEYGCSGVFVCCDTPKIKESCSEKGGDICTSNEVCSGGSTEDTPGLDSGDSCCVGGYCKDESAPVEESTCVSSGGICESSCGTGYEQSSAYDCSSALDSCCVKSSTPQKNYTWIYILIGFIILFGLGILFRDKLRPFFFRAKSFFRKSPPGGGNRGPRMPPRNNFLPPSRMNKRIMPRRILPPNKNQPIQRPLRRPFPKKPTGELDDVLKKLKEMGN